MFKKLIAPCLVIILLLIFSACGPASAPTTVVEPTSAPTEANASAGASAPAGNKIIFGLDWAFVGQHVPFFVALDKGFWKEEGLEVEIVRGYGSADAVQKVASGANAIGYGDTGSLVVGRANEGVDVKLIGMLLGLPPHAVIYKMDQPLTKPADFEGKKIGAAAGDSVRRVFPAFAKTAGFDINKVQFETIGYEIYSAELLSGRIDGLAEYYAAKPNYDKAAKENGLELGILKFSDFGLDIYSNGFLAKESFIAQNPDQVRAFLKGVYRGFAYAYKNVDESVDIFLKHEPTLDREVVKQQFLLDKPAVLNKDVLANGYGHIDTKKMQTTIDVMKVAYELSGKVPQPEEMFTLEFLPSKGEIPPTE
jgi:NitT/TauT family transport system substrate-binding protein